MVGARTGSFLDAGQNVWSRLEHEAQSLDIELVRHCGRRSLSAAKRGKGGGKLGTIDDDGNWRTQFALQG